MFSLLKDRKEFNLFSGSDLKKLIIPLLIEQALMSLLGMVDTMMVAGCGEAVVSGVSLVDMINNMVINIFAAIATGGAVICSQLLGCRKRDKACDSTRHLMAITALISIFIAAIAVVFRSPLLDLIFGAIEKEVKDNAVIYLLITALSYPFIAIQSSCSAVFRSQGNTQITMKISALMNLINVVVNAILIFGFNMGAAGAAFGTLVSRAAAAFIIFAALTKPDQQLYIDIHKKYKPDFNVIGNMMRIGIPGGIENSIFQLGRIVVVSIITTFGTTQIAANAVANNLDGLGCIPGQAFNLAMITVIGRCVGAGDDKQTMYFIKKLMLIAYMIGFAANGLILITMPVLISLYNLSPETSALATKLVLIHNGCAILLWPASFTLSNALRAASDIKFTMIVSIFSMIAFRVMLSFVLGGNLGWGALGVWAAMIIDWIFRASMFVWRTASGKWRGRCFVN